MTAESPPQSKEDARWRQRLLGGAKLLICASILGYLFHQAAQNESFETLRTQPKRWHLLAAGFGIALTAVCITMMRWFLLVRALDLPFTKRDAFRLGFIGYLFNFLTLGIVGGDLLKSIFIARQQQGRRAEAVATVVVDRVIGLYALFVMASGAMLFVKFSPDNVRAPANLESFRRIGFFTIGFAAAGPVGLLLLLSPLATKLRVQLKRLPKVGKLASRLMDAVLIYRAKLRVILLAFLFSLLSHGLFAICIFVVAEGLPGAHPDLPTHFAVVPIANVAGALPLPGGIGAFELALNLLYGAVSSADVAESQGFIVALAYRVITILIAMVGLGFYRSSRKEIQQLAREAEAMQQE